jgi:N-sulfoglucosamine sulfohydrolase
MRILTFFFAAIAFAACGLAPARAAPPNLVVFISDDHGYFDSEVTGATSVRTPNMLRLAKAGMTFTRAFAASPACAPSRAALLTGLMPMRNGSMLNHQPPRADVKKLPGYLQELGYEVVAFGKVAHYKQAKDYGFDHASHDTFHDHEGIPAALKFLRGRKSTKPLCLLVGTNWPHVPWPKVEPDGEVESKLQLPPTHVDTPETRRWRRRYYAAVEKMDADLGQIYDAAYKDLGENTLFIHFSDHGAQWPLGKWNLYDAGVRVPFFAVWSGKIKRGGKSDAMISLVDVLPTLIEAAGGIPPASIDGRSRLSVLTGDSTTTADYVFTTHSGDGRMNKFPGRSVRTPRWKYIRNLNPDAEHHTHIDRGKAIDGNGYWRSWIEKAKTDDDAKAIVARYFRRPAEELYDLEADPHEQHNLADDATSHLPLNLSREMLDAWMKQQGDEGLATEKAVAESFKPE